MCFIRDKQFVGGGAGCVGGGLVVAFVLFCFCLFDLLPRVKAPFIIASR